MEHPVVGGYEPHKVALRRAHRPGLRRRSARSSSCAGPGRCRRRRSLPPGVSGYDPKLQDRDERLRPARAPARCSTCTATSTATATAGASSPTASRWCWNSRPSPPSWRAQLQRAVAEGMKASACASSSRSPPGRRTSRPAAPASCMMWGTGWSGRAARRRLFPRRAATARNKGQSNHARFDLPAFNALYERQRALPDGPERDALIQQALQAVGGLHAAQGHRHPSRAWVTHPRVHGYVPHPFIRDILALHGRGSGGPAH